MSTPTMKMPLLNNISPPNIKILQTRKYFQDIEFTKTRNFVSLTNSLIHSLTIVVMPETEKSSARLLFYNTRITH